MTDTDTTAALRSKPPHDDVAVVLAAHGSTRRPDANATVTAHAERMREIGPFRNVSTVFLLDDNAAADAAVNAIDAETVLIVPFMMSDGFLSGEISAQISKTLQIAARPPRIVVAPPVGTHDGITAIARHIAGRALARAGFDARAATLVLVAHGSKGRPESKACAETHAVRLRTEGDFADVKLAMLEEPPMLDDVLAAIDGPAAVAGLFAAPGGHALDDVRTAIARCANREIVDAGPVGIDARMAEIAIMRAQQALAS